MNIRNKIILPFLILVIILAAVASSMLYIRGINFFKSETYVHLESVAAARADSVETLLEKQKERIALLASDDRFRDYLLQPQSQKAGEEATNALRSFLDNYFFELSLLDKDGNFVLSTSSSAIGLSGANDDYFTNARNQAYSDDIYYSSRHLEPVMAFSAPVRDQDRNFTGVLMGYILPDNLYSILNEENEAGADAGWSYIVNRDGYIISPPYYDSDRNLILEQKISTKNFQDCQEVMKGDMALEKYTNYVPDPFMDYREVPVLGAHAYIPGMEWCILSELDESHISDTFNNNFLFILVAGGLLFILLFAVTGYVVGSIISQPIDKLKSGAEIIRAGNLDYRVALDSKDEIGELSRTLDQIALIIQNSEKSRTELTQEMEVQNAEIKDRKEYLENQQKAVLSILEDIQEEKQKVERLAQELEKFKLAVDNASDQIVITDEEGAIVYANLATEKITGYAVKDILGKKTGTKELWGGNMKPDFYKQLWKIIKTEKKVFVGGMENKTKHGKWYDTVVQITPILDKSDNVIFFVAIERDVTKEKEVDRAKTEFVSLASHQLRTPLSSINWYAEMLMEGDAGKLNETQMNYLKEIYYGNQRMVALVNALLNVSRLELGTFIVEPESVDIRAIADVTIKEIQVQLDEKKITLVKEYDKKVPLLKLDKKLTDIIFQNLLSNALKYTPEKGKITVTVKKTSKEVVVSVTDTGYGIPLHQQDKIFTKLFRADNVRQKDTQGTGLGLYMVKSILEHAGGKIWFKSKEGKGTTFFVTIPLKGMKKKEGSKKLS